MLGDFALSLNGFGQGAFNGPAILTDSCFKGTVGNAGFSGPFFKRLRLAFEGAFLGPRAGDHRLRESTLNGPAKFADSCFKGAVRNANLLGPFCKGFCDTVPGDESVSTSVSRLLFRCRPSAVFRAVVAVVVDAVKRRAGGPRADIGKKVFKGLQPAVADFDAAASVVLVFFVLNITAPLFHHAPCSVFGSPNPSSGVAVRQTFGGIQFSLQAPARLRDAAAQAISRHDRLLPAIAAALPVVPPLALSDTRNHREPSVAVRRSVNESRHGNLHQRSSEIKPGRAGMNRLFG